MNDPVPEGGEKKREKDKLSIIWCSRQCFFCGCTFHIQILNYGDVSKMVEKKQRLEIQMLNINEAKHSV